MFTRFPLRTRLDQAIALSVAAMLGFNLLVLAQQLQEAPPFAFHSAAAERQA